MLQEHESSHRFGRQRVKVRFTLAPEDRAYGVDAESLWAEIVSDGRYRIDNIPFYVYDVSLGDTVGGDLVDDRIACPEVLERGGHSTYRVLVKHDAGFESKSFTDFWRELERLGCSYEVAKRCWIAIDVPPATDVFAVYRILETGENDGAWSFEEGHCGHVT
jgi:Domain of unknown function (DUF4265)